MTTDTIMLLAMGFSMLVAVAAWMLLRISQDEERFGVRVTETQRKPVAAAPQRRHVRPEHRLVAAVKDLISSIGETIANSGVMSRRMLADLEQTLISSGLTSNNALGLFIGSKLLMLTTFPLLILMLLHGVVDPLTAYGLAAGGAGIGMLAPDWLAQKFRTKYVERVSGGLPDALDLLLICAQSGLALEPSLSRVETEMRTVHPDLAWELAQTVAELQILSDSRVALVNLGTRTKLDGFKRLSSTLIQTMQFGTPLSEALRLLAQEMRHEVMMNFEAKAARLPVLLTLPMVAFIMPSVFIVVGGPAVVQLMRGFMA